MEKEKTKIHKAKKSLGQNFLKSKTVLKKIVEVSNIEEGDTILEIGPGKGALTEFLLNTNSKVIAVEKDDNLYSLLQEKFKKEIEDGKLILVKDDILEFNLNSSNYKIVANIPYNITGAILKKFLTNKYQPKSMTLLVQKEVAGRIVANDKKESLLSMSVKAYGEPKIIMKVQAKFFSPAPKVDSSVIKISNISNKNFKNKASEEKFWEILHAGFAHKRKKLSNNLKKYAKNKIFNEIKDKRAEDLSLDLWLALARESLE